MSHGHGRVECSECGTIVQSCRCMEAGKTVEYVVCPKCKADKAYKVMQRTSEFNQKLKELGVSAFPVEQPRSDEGNV